jgi:hypothetical protein
MTTSPAQPVWVHDGFTFDLTRAWLDVFGHRWEWTGETAADGEPLMRSLTDHPDLSRTVLQLSEVYVMFGPLTPAPAPITSDAVRAVLLDDREDRGPACMACHDIGCVQCTRPPLPVRTHAAPIEQPKPNPGPDAGDQADEKPKPAAPAVVPAVVAPSPSTFARLLTRLRGGAR